MVGWDRWEKGKPRQGMLNVVKRAFAARGRCQAPGLNCPVSLLLGWLLGVVMAYPSLAANRTRLGGVVGKRAEAQMRVVVDEACDDDDDGVGGRQMPTHPYRAQRSRSHCCQMLGVLCIQ
jgi:hypothetical protein